MATPPDIDELMELETALEELRELQTVPNEEIHRAFLRLENDQVLLERLAQMVDRRRFDIDVFEALRLDGSEEFHSNFLAWLLDPRGSHRIGDFALREFLREFGYSRDVPAANLPSTTVSRERGVVIDVNWGRLDITIMNEKSNFVCVIENKVWSPEGRNQLADYRKALDECFPCTDYKVRRVFLTPQGDGPGDIVERDHWTAMSYKKVLCVIERIIREKEESINEDVGATLRQYATTLRRNIVPDVSNDVHELARRIYRKHKQAIDLIIENRERYQPNYVVEGFRMVRKAIQEHCQWKEHTVNHPYARFVSADWKQYEELETDGWPHGLLHFEVQVTERWAGLFLLFSKSGDKTLKRMIYDRVAKIPDVFEEPVPSYSDDYIRLKISKDVLEEQDHSRRWDEEATQRLIAGKLDDFAKDQFPLINQVVLECLEEFHSVPD